jgi:hypothetical protein
LPQQRADDEAPHFQLGESVQRDKPRPWKACRRKRSESSYRLGSSRREWDSSVAICQRRSNTDPLSPCRQLVSFRLPLHGAAAGKFIDRSASLLADGGLLACLLAATWLTSSTAGRARELLASRPSDVRPPGHQRSRKSRRLLRRCRSPLLGRMRRPERRRPRRRTR